MAQNLPPRSKTAGRTSIAAKTVRDWEHAGIVDRYVARHVATLQAQQPYMAAFYDFPKIKEKLADLLHQHGTVSERFSTRSEPSKTLERVTRQ